MTHKVHWHADEWVVPGTWYVMFVVTDESGNNHSHFHVVRNTAEALVAIKVLAMFAAAVIAELEGV